MITKICENCGNEFYPPKSRVRFCSRSCSNSATKTRIDKYAVIAMWRNGISVKEIAERNGSTESYIKKLIQKEIPKEEREKYNAQRELHKREKEFIKKLSNGGFDYEYIGGYRNNISKVTLRCKRCGEIVEINASFLRKRRSKEHSCCLEKKRLYKRLIDLLVRKQKMDLKIAREKEKRARGVKLIRECTECGRVFRAKSIRMICCSSECSRKRENRIKEIKRRQRMKGNGEIDYSISLSKLIKRDKGICSICGRIVDINADPNSDEYPSIDHILPLSKGGTHTWDNVQLAHRGCNTMKSDKLLIERSDKQLKLCL